MHLRRLLVQLVLAALFAACGDQTAPQQGAMMLGGSPTSPVGSQPASVQPAPISNAAGQAEPDGSSTQTGAGSQGLPPASEQAGSTAGTQATPMATGGAGAGMAGAPSAGTGGQAPTPGSCARSAGEVAPFGCDFAWGTNDPGGSLAGLGYLDFMSKWVGYETDADGNLSACDGCSWLDGELEGLGLVPVYYAYFVGFLGHENGFMDGNQTPGAPNLTTHGAELIREHRQTLIDMYAWYAQRSHQAWPDRLMVWLLEGDFVQYAGESQREPLSYDELAQFTAEVTCAIKSNMPNALVAINHSTWNPDQVTNDFWNAMEQGSVAYDLVWTTGVADNEGFLEAGGHSGIYNAATATYAYLHRLTARPILVDTSFGLSAMADSWSGATPEVLDARIADGVIAANVATTSADYQAAIAALAPQLRPVCAEP